jgi:hypothetical protein
MKKLKQHLAQDEFNRFLYNYFSIKNTYKYTNQASKSEYRHFSNYILNGFQWDLTLEGSSYWSDIFERVWDIK